MGFFKSKTNIIFLFVIFLLVACIAATSYFAYGKHKDYVAVSASLSSNSTALEQTQMQIDELTIRINEYDANSATSAQELADLRSQLQEALDKKAQFEQENSSLKEEVEQLKIEKYREELQRYIVRDKVKQASTTTPGVCYLTFDDGPSDNTLRILDILDTYGVKATFFVVGTAKTQYLPQIASRGHAIGLHTASHKYEMIYKDINSYLEDVKQISDIVYSKTGVRSNILRFPGGSSNVISANYCEGIMSDLTVRMPELGYSYYDWNVDSGDADAAKVSTDKIVQNVLNGAKGKRSICVLMHDNGGKDTTAEALPRIITGLRNMGFTFAPITAADYGFHQPVAN